jgi:hypothetical protein
MMIHVPEFLSLAFIRSAIVPHCISSGVMTQPCRPTTIHEQHPQPERVCARRVFQDHDVQAI